MRKLTDPEVTKELQHLAGWEKQSNAISRLFDRKTFQGSIAFVNTLSEIATRADHHPDIDIRYSKVRVTLSTHDTGGITDKDIALARQITAAADEVT
jgi:4a-hydroxytetrahydrobiopterin dehydratase